MKIPLALLLIVVANATAGCLNESREQPLDASAVISRGLNGEHGNMPSSYPVIASGGDVVVYYTLSSNVLPDDNELCNIDDRMPPYNCPDWVVWRRGSGSAFLAQDTDGRTIAAFTSAVVSLSEDGGKAVFQAIGLDEKWGIFVKDLETGSLERIVEPGTWESRDQNDSYCGVTCGDPSIDFSGRYVTFDSFAAIESPDANRNADFFLHDLQTGTTERISKGMQVESDGNSFALFGRNQVSRDGRWVVFESTASNLDERDHNSCPYNGESSSFHGPSCMDIFIRDRLEQTTRLAFVTPAGTSPQRESWFSSISASGEILVFSSDASDVVPGDKNNARDVFYLNRTTGVLHRVSVANDGLEGSNESYGPSMDAAGVRILFLSRNRLTADDVDDFTDAFVYVRSTDELHRVQRPDEPAATGDVFEARISPDGEWITYTVAPTEPGKHRQVLVQRLFDA
ncbi:MAG: hypothetical protein WC876_08165 [Candidatus Thermoplasmatota archaeon]|jgi:Tol biopolymer transport system component